MVTVLNRANAPKEPVTVCMIVKNEEHNLQSCLRSVGEWAAQIVVVDTGSTDNTVQVAKSFGAEVYDFPWKDDFSAARNESIKHAKCEWLLFLDADEALAEESKPVLHELFRSYEVASLVTIRNWVSGPSVMIFDRPAQQSPVGWYIDFEAIRVARNMPGVKFSLPIHENLDECFAGKPLNAFPGILLHHYGKLDNNAESSKDGVRLNMAIRAMETTPNTTTCFNVIQEALRMKDWRTALKAGNKFMQFVEIVPPNVYFMILQAALGNKNYKEAEIMAEEILAKNWNNAPTLEILAEVHAQTGRIDSAEAYFKAAIVRGSEVAAINLATMYRALGRHQEAREALEAGLRYIPCSIDIAKELK